MEKHQVDIEKVKRAFNHLNVARGQYVTIATSDEAGMPNAAPIGSMRMVNESVVHVLQGFLDKTMTNLKGNPKVAFAVKLETSILDYFSLFREKKYAVMGYRVYGTLQRISEDRGELASEVEAIAARVPFFLKGGFKKFAKANLNHLLVFSVDDIRVI